jgi:hypothetical protein
MRFSRELLLQEELAQGRRVGRETGRIGKPERVHDRQQHAFMLVNGAGALPISRQYVRSPKYRRHLPPAVRCIGGIRFIEVHDQNAIAAGAKCTEAGEQRYYAGLQPTVSLQRRTVVRVVVNVGNDEGELRQRVVGQVDSELRERRNDAIGDLGVIRHIGEQRERVVADDVSPGVSAQITLGDAFGIDFESYAGSEHAAGDVIHVPHLRRAVVRGENLSCCEHEVIADGWMRVGVVTGGECAVTDQRIQIGPIRGVSYYAGVALIFLHHEHHVFAGRNHVGDGERGGAGDGAVLNAGGRYGDFPGR